MLPGLPDQLVFVREELEVLFFRPDLASAYLVVRMRMDPRTGLMGIRPRISWRAMCEWMEAPARPGVHRNRLSEQQARRVMRQLEIEGLIKNRSEGRKGRLIFEAIFWGEQKSVRNKPDRGLILKPTGFFEAKAAPMADLQPIDAKSRQGDDSKADIQTGQDSTYVESSSSPPPHEAIDEEEGRREDQDQNLTWPVLHDDTRMRIARQIAGRPDAQLLLDVLAVQMRDRERRSDPIGRPSAYMHTIINSVTSPRFDPTPALNFARDRERRAAAGAAAPSPANSAQRSAPTPEYMAVVAKLKKTR